MYISHLLHPYPSHLLLPYLTNHSRLDPAIRALPFQEQPPPLPPNHDFLPANTSPTLPLISSPTSPSSLLALAIHPLSRRTCPPENRNTPARPKVCQSSLRGGRAIRMGQV